MTLYSPWMDDNYAENGGALAIHATAAPGLSVRIIAAAYFIENGAQNDGGAVWIGAEPGVPLRVSLEVTVAENVAGLGGSCALGGGGLAIDTASTTVEIDLGNASGYTGFYDSNIADGDGCNGGGAAIRAEGGNLRSFGYFTRNEASSVNGAGGGLFIDMPGAVLLEADFFVNRAADGGGVYDARSTSLTLNQAGAVGNAVTGNGGGMMLASSAPVSFVYVSIVSNSAGADGGGIYLATPSAHLTGVSIGQNETEGSGGGLYSAGNLTLFQSTIGGNRADTSPDCFAAGGIDSLGQSRVEDVAGCGFVPGAGDRYDNLLENSYFFDPVSDGITVNEKLPAEWTGKRLTGDKRKCFEPDPDSPFPDFRICYMQFKGGEGENALLYQDIDLVEHTLAQGDALIGDAWAALIEDVFAYTGPTYKIKVKIKYADPTLEKDKFTFKPPKEDPSPYLQTKAFALQGTPDNMRVSINHRTQTPQKLRVFYVALMRVSEPIDIASREAGADVLPPPTAPDGFRGGN